MTEPVEHHDHTGKLEIGWPPGQEPGWNPERIRAVALELAIKTVTDHPTLINPATGNATGTANIVMAIADRYRGFIGRTEATDA